MQNPNIFVFMGNERRGERMTREEAIKILSNRDGYGIPSGYNGGYAEAIEVAIEALKAEPIKHGKWILVMRSAFKNFYICSECHRKIEDCDAPALIPIRYPYCHCGAKMDEVKE